MAQLSHVVDICGPVDVVFGLLADPERDPEWAGPVVEVERLDRGPVGVGARFRQIARTLGFRFSMQIAVAVYEPNRLIVMESVGGAAGYRGERYFESTADGTRVTFVGHVRLPRPLRLVEPLAVRASGGRVDQDLQEVKRRLEATPA